MEKYLAASCSILINFGKLESTTTILVVSESENKVR